MPSALSWTLVAAVSLLAASLAAPTDTPDLVISTGVSTTPTGPPATSAETKASEDAAAEATEGPLLPLKVSSMNVTSVIDLRYAHTTVLTKMKNPAKKSQEATFSIILPETAFITGFVMTLDGKPYAAYVKEKEEAKNIYNQAVSQGLGAAHIAAKARDSNHFTVSVNVEPSTEALFNLTYEELLTRRLEVYNHVVNLNPGRLVPDLTVNIYIKEGKKITTLRVPELRTGNEVDAQEGDTANEFAKIERNDDNTEAYIKFAPNLEQQEALMQVYAEKSKKSAASQSDNYNRWNSPTEKPSTEGVLGQFVVQYDVERDPNNGEVMVNDGYFVHFFSPSGLKPLNKHVIFVLDTSGSMIGRKIQQLKEAMKAILSELKAGDYFNIIEFNFNSQVYDLENLKERQKFTPTYGFYNPVTEVPTDTVLPPPAPATPENIQRAKVVIDNLEANGGTNIYDALNLAVKVANNGISKSNVTSADLPEIPHTNLFPEDDVGLRVNADVDDQKPDPIIIFLTDGDPTVGETNVERILGRVSELNSGPNQTAIFSLAFGGDADRDFLRKLSLRNSGFLRHIYEAADAAQQLQNFYSQVANPLLSHVRFTYPADQIEEGSITKHHFRTLFCGTELVVAGKLLNKDVERVTPTVTAISSVGPIDFIPKPPTPVKENKVFRPLERLWVYLHIKQLLDQKDVADKTPEGDKSETANKKKPEQEALELALKYSFVTPLTSLVVVKPNDTAAVNAESVDKAHTLGGYPLQHQALYASFMPGLPGPPSASFAPMNLYPASISAGGGYSGGGVSYDLSAPASAFGGFAPSYEESSDLDSLQSQLPEEEESADRISGAAYPVPSTTYAVPIYTTPRAPSKLQEYSLLEFPWLEQYLDVASDSLNLPVNGTMVNLKLSKGTLPTFTSDESTCTESLTAGSEGTCKYLTDCAAAKTIASLDVFLQHRCEREGYAAVCCPAQP